MTRTSVAIFYFLAVTACTSATNADDVDKNRRPRERPDPTRS